MNFFHSFLDLVYPPQCLLCQAKPSDKLKILCDVCHEAICFNTPPFCKKCSRHLLAPGEHTLCPQCRKRIPDFDMAWSATIYNEPMKHLLHLFKYQRKTTLKYLLTDLICTFLEQYHIPIQTFDYLVPIPVHPTKQREREFNQTQLIAELLAKRFHRQISINNLIRVKHSRPQAVLEEKERWTNIKDAFRIRHSFSFKNKSILLIDDLMTTGATACEAAKVCKQAQASSVGILTLAVGQ
ncbi:MAG: ComF family protein [Candidatus Omnitrophota bacterium]